MRFCARHSGSVRCLACNLRLRRVGARRTGDNPRERRSGGGLDDRRDGAPERQLASASPLAAARSLPKRAVLELADALGADAQTSGDLAQALRLAGEPRTTIRSLSPRKQIAQLAHPGPSWSAQARNSPTSLPARTPAVMTPSTAYANRARRCRGWICLGPRASSHGRYSSVVGHPGVERALRAAPRAAVTSLSSRPKPPVGEIKGRRLLEADECRPWEAAGSVTSRRAAWELLPWRPSAGRVGAPDGSGGRPGLTRSAAPRLRPFRAEARSAR
jgi:hypothetical protein